MKNIDLSKNTISKFDVMAERLDLIKARIIALTTTTLDYYVTPDHGYFKASVKEVLKLGILDLISELSFIKAGFIYLEEDHDAALYISALTDVGQKVELNTIYLDNSIHKFLKTA
jgi:hypothetical protein